LYKWLVGSVLGQHLPGASRRWIVLGILAVLALFADVAALVTMMTLMSAIFEPSAMVTAEGLDIRHLMGALLAAFVCRGVFNFLLQTGRRDLSRQWALRVTEKLTRHTLAMPLSVHRKWQFGETMNLVVWVTGGLAEVVEMAVVALPLNLVTLAALLLFLGFYRPLLTLILLLVFTLYAVPYLLFKDRAEWLAGMRQEIGNSFFETFSQVLLGIREVKAFRTLERWVGRFQDTYRGLEETGGEESRLNELDSQAQLFLFNAVGTIVILGAVLFVLAPALPDPRQRQVLTGQVLVFVLAQSLLSQPLLALMYAARSYRDSYPKLLELRRILAEPEEDPGQDGPPLSGFGTIEVQDVHLGQALEGVSATVREGTLVGLVGMSGAGKSTFLDLLPRFAEPESGVVRIGERDVREIDLGTLRKTVVAVAQKPVLFSGTVKDNLGEASEERLKEALRLAQIDLEKDRRFQEKGLGTEVARMAENFSGGEAQRLSLARALVAQPRILLLDEATSNLDPLGEANFFRELAATRAQRTTLAITHRLYALTPLCDLLLVFENGKIVARGTHSELLAQGGLYQQLWEAQIALVKEELRSLQELAHAGGETHA